MDLQVKLYTIVLLSNGLGHGLGHGMSQIIGSYHDADAPYTCDALQIVFHSEIPFLLSKIYEHTLGLILKLIVWVLANKHLLAR